MTDEPVLPIVQEACNAYFRDQPELLEHRQAHPNERWVAYHGNRRIGIGQSKQSLVAECLQQGIPIGEFLVIDIDASVKPMMESSL
jgi:hypothetical protein